MSELNLNKDYSQFTGTVTTIDWAQRLGVTRQSIHMAYNVGGIPPETLAIRNTRRWDRRILEMFCDGLLERRDDGHWYNRLSGALVTLGSQKEAVA